MSSDNSLQKARMRPGDFHLPGDARNRFGQMLLLATNAGTVAAGNSARKSAPFVETPTYDEPQMWELELRVSAPLYPSNPILPAGAYFLRVKVRRALDRDKGTVEDVYLLAPIGEGPINTLPVGCVIAQQLGVYVEIIHNPALPDPSAAVTVEVTATRTDCCARDAWASPTIVRKTQSATSANFLPSNPLRRQFLVQNWGSSPLYIAFGFESFGPGSSGPKWTVALPAQGDIYESFRDGYCGPVAGIWDTDDAAGYALVTEGL